MPPRRSVPAANAGHGRQVALLRGVNVGRAKRVAMADLRAIVTDLGYDDARTFLNSGNVVFTAPGVRPSVAAARIERELAARLGLTVRVMALSAAELDAVVTGNPFHVVASNPSRLLVAVLGDPADAARLAPLARQDWGTEMLAIGERVAYLWCPDGVLVGRLSEAVSKALGDSVTTRNWATMTKLHALMAAARPT